MDIPVYKLYLMKYNLEAMRLPLEKKQEAAQLAARALADVGAKNLLMADIFSSEQYLSFGVEWYPSLQAVIEHTRCLAEVNWFQYADAEIFLGTQWFGEMSTPNLEPYHPVAGAPAPIYKAWISRMGVETLNPTPEEKEWTEKVNAQASELGIVKHIPGMATIQFNESWTVWGLERYPNHKSLEQIYQTMLAANWWKHSRAKSYLGIATGGELSGLP